ncbi:MAG: BamA/TamA family outer membrane protein, partial [Acidobacteriota bacterium]
WYARDGMHVRSPVRFGGVTVGEAARREYEADWIRREKARQERRAKNQKEKGEISIGSEGVTVSGGGVPTEPRFVSEAYFMDFKFEPGNYYLAGRETLEGHDVLRIEYYPTRLFNDSDDEKTPRELKKKPSKSNPAGQRDQQQEQDIDRKMNKTALVTLWVDPAEHQIVKYTFDNVWLDFLPGSWLVRIDDLRASMTMGQPFPGVWLPRVMNIHAGLTLASGSFEATYARSFSDYREGDVKTKISVPKGNDTPEPEAVHQPGNLEKVHGPFVPDDPPQPAETIREIRVHGNASLADEAVLKLAGIAIGDAIPDDAVKAIERRLKDSERFETVEVRKRYRSLDDPTDVAIVLVVHERPGVTTATPDARPLSNPWYRVKSRLMFLPILSYADGYGVTYGGRVSTVDLLGAGERLSVPLTWGGTRRAALEAERTFKSGPLTRISSAFGIWQRDNPRFDLADRRVELKGRAERQFAQVVRLGVEAARSSVSFGQLDDRIWTVGANAMLDTRDDPSFPRNAVVLGGGWSALNVTGLTTINRYQADARGYAAVVGQSVAAARVQYFSSDATLPPYERLLLGGASTLRGFRTGTFDGDRMLVTSAELRTPITSVVHGAKLGVTVFVDAAKAVDAGASLRDGVWHRGAGAGLFLLAPLVKINLDVAHGLDGGGARLNIGSGFSF